MTDKPMKFKIYKPTGSRAVNDATLPWVYDQDKQSGAEASMWVTPVATLPNRFKDKPDAWGVTWNGELTGNVFPSREHAEMCKHNLDAKYEAADRQVVAIYMEAL